MPSFSSSRKYVCAKIFSFTAYLTSFQRIHPHVSPPLKVSRLPQLPVGQVIYGVTQEQGLLGRNKMKMNYN